MNKLSDQLENWSAARIEHWETQIRRIRDKAWERVWSPEAYRARETYLMSSLPSLLDAFEELMNTPAVKVKVVK